MTDSAFIEVRRAIIMPPVTVLQKKVLMLQRAPEPISKSDALKLECPGGKVEDGEDPLATLVREVHEECGLTVVKIVRGPYDYSRPAIILDERKTIYAVQHFFVEVHPFKIDELRLSREHVRAELVCLDDIIAARHQPIEKQRHPSFPYRQSAIRSLVDFAEDIGLLPTPQELHPELFPKHSPPRS